MMKSKGLFMFGAGFLVACLLFALVSWQSAATMVSVSADRMNVFYLGVDNPVTIVSTDGVVRAEQVHIEGGSISGGNGKFTVTATQRGPCKITVKTNGGEQHFSFRVKSIPDPIAALGGGSQRHGGNMKLGEFKAQRGVMVMLENFDFDARCSIVSYQLVQVRGGSPVSSVINEGGAYNEEAQKMVSNAQVGDVFFFDDIKSRCPGDAMARDLGSMSFKLE